MAESLQYFGGIFAGPRGDSCAQYLWLNLLESFVHIRIVGKQRESITVWSEKTLRRVHKLKVL